MYNCVILKLNGRPFGIFKTIEQAEFVRNTLQDYGPLSAAVNQWNIDWAFIESLPF
jgi:hypothetical protein